MILEKLPRLCCEMGWKELKAYLDGPDFAILRQDEIRPWQSAEPTLAAWRTHPLPLLAAVQAPPRPFPVFKAPPVFSADSPARRELVPIQADVPVEPGEVIMAIKTLFFIETLRGGGAEKVLCDLVNAMDPEKFEITVQTLWKADASRFLKPWIRYRYCYAAPGRLNSLRSRAEAAAGLIYPLHIRDNYELEVAYLEFGSTKILAGSTNKKAKKIAWVHSDLAQKLNGKPETLQKAAAQYEAYDRIVCVSQTARDSFIRLFGRERDTVVLYNTIDDESIREKAKLAPAVPFSKRRLTVAAVGRLSEEKQYDMLLRIHKQLLDEGLVHDLWIVGEGDQRALLEAYISENKLSDSVTLFGFQSNPYPFMKAADLLVCSSRYEGLSTFVTEGLILGKPIVTTECSGMRELLGDSEYGMITENSENALLGGMRKMLSSQSTRAYYFGAAMARGRAFSADRLANLTEQFFEDTIKGSQT